MEINDMIRNDVIPVFMNFVIIGFVATVALMIGFKFYYLLKNSIINEKRKNAIFLLSTLGFKNVISKLNKYELIIASQLVDPKQIDVSFADIAGLEIIVDSIKSNVIFPLLLNTRIRGKYQYLQPPKGVLLYGPPGCGKTMIAKAIAKETNARFLNLVVPTLTDKWYGESQKLALAVFTLAEKLQPCVIFIDEIDTFLRSRGLDDHEATTMMKAQFMILWDGLYSRKDSSGVIVLGATNRPHDVDDAILRRMPSTFEIPLPNCYQRKEILSISLIDEPLEIDVNLEILAELTDGFSASDLKELCRNACFARLREQRPKFLKVISDSKVCNIENELSEFITKMRNVRDSDFQSALIIIKDSKESYKKFDAHSC